ncbi:MAG: GH116 family glycosyl hydrolase [Phycisphaerae bacterium]
MACEQINDTSMRRRDFLKKSVVTAGAIGSGAGAATTGCSHRANELGPREIEAGGMTAPMRKRSYNDVYTGPYLNRVAFPLGGIGAGMFCLEGTGAISHLSLRHQPEVFNEPCTFAAVCVKGEKNIARVLEGPVPGWKVFGAPGSGNGAAGKTYGLPRFREASFKARFPFGTVALSDSKVPLAVEITGWSPFEPGDPDNSSLPVAGLEYKFTNTSKKAVDAVFSFNTRNFMAIGDDGHGVRASHQGFVLWEKGSDDKPWEQGEFSVSVTDPEVKVNHAWFRGGWWDPLTMAWNDVQNGACYDRPPVSEGGPAPGASLFVPFSLAPGKSKTIVLQVAGYVGKTTLRIGYDPKDFPESQKDRFSPWYSGRFANVDAVAAYWREGYNDFRSRAERFADCLYATSFPPEVMEAVAANLTILKSPTVLRQTDGRLWCWEGCSDDHGCCHGTCTHVWNYAQAIPHLFPSLERTLRETEFHVSQDDRGHQAFRASLPIRPPDHGFHAAADGQLGGIMKAYREWRISGDTEWLKAMWPKVKQSLDYCINTWDPGHKGVLEEPHHNTYDIEFWGPDGMCSSFYVGALTAAVKMGKALDQDVSLYEDLAAKGTRFIEEQLFDGEYFFQKIQWTGLKAANPLDAMSLHSHYSPEAIELFKKEGPKYQYGTGCLSDGVLGSWIAMVCGVGQVLDPGKVTSHLKSVYKYNLKHDLSDHANPQRPSYACNSEGGLLLCTWPKGGKLSLPFVYSDEVWTGIEYQVASHLILMGLVDEALDIVRTCRDRYDGRIRNPFNEYECGHWYARAMSSYALLQSLSGARYDAVEKVLYVEPRIKGDFRCFLATAVGYGIVGVKDGKAFYEPKVGPEINEIKYTPMA